MRIYIAGKITGLDPAEAERLFTEAETAIEKAGHMPLNPLKLVDQAPGRHYNEYLADALNILLKQGEAIWLLDNWQHSKGALIEHRIARMLDIPRYYQELDDELPIGSDWPEQAE
jgi:hypothetical protein